VIGQFQLAELQAISYSITREKAPIYTMGSADPRYYSRNKRGIAGSIIWINFDRHALLALFNKARGKFCCQTALQSRFSCSFGPFPTMEIRYRIAGPNVGFIQVFPARIACGLLAETKTCSHMTKIVTFDEKSAPPRAVSEARQDASPVWSFRLLTDPYLSCWV
jgi:hypothetical protein